MTPLYYVSSKLKHRDKWLTMGLTLVSTWTELDEEVAYDQLSAMWDNYRKDMSWADIFVMYLEEGETPKGALIELGAAFQLELPIYFIWQGTREELAKVVGTIVYHDSVHIVKSSEELPRE